MKCKRCAAKATVQLRSHNTAFCKECFVFFFQRNVERSIERERMFTREEPVLVAVSGGKDSLALWDTLVTLGYRTEGLYLGLGIGAYSAASQRKAEAYAAARDLPLRIMRLEEEGDGLAIPEAAFFTRRQPCAACGTFKRHHFDRAALDGGFAVLATGHNLDDEAARLLGNVLHWQLPYLAKQHPVLTPTHPKFVRKVRPLYRTSEYESATYAFLRGIDYVVEECPNSHGATQLVYKDLLNRLEETMPGSKLAFVSDFLRHAHPLFAGAPDSPAGECARCGMPAFAELCGYCRLVAEIERRRSQAVAHS
ncbi:MAG: adenine nucleotide alpha hydrolase family protein [Deltaproteobacteria bacterium]|nr:adenine nucleotide alpha hydrolase family protein [Deltaproteobacteria bacterium]